MTATEHHEQGSRHSGQRRYSAEAIADNIRNLIRAFNGNPMRAEEVTWLRGLLEQVKKGPALIEAHPETKLHEYYGYERPAPRKLDLSTGGM